MADKKFDLSKVTISIIVDGVPIDISTGMAIEADFLKVVRENKEDVKTRKGTKGQSYSVNSTEDNNRLITLMYIPGSDAIPVLHKLRKQKKSFGIAIDVNTVPNYKLIGSAAEIIEEPDFELNGKDGAKDQEFKIRVPDSEVEYLG